MPGRSQSSPWRQLATAVYGAPSDGRIFGALELDVTDACDFIERRRSAGVPLTLTHLVTAALARALVEDVPELNCFVRRGRVVAREHVDVSLAVDLKGGDLASVRIRDAHRKTLAEIAKQVHEAAERHRAGRESALNRNKGWLGAIPWPLRRPLLRALTWAVTELGFESRRLGISADAFGSILLSNIGTHGLATAMLALMPIARLPAAIAMGRAEPKPVARDGAVVIRRMLPVSGTFDHRLVDGALAGRLARALAQRLARPELLDAV